VKFLEEKREKPYIYPHKHCVICGKMLEMDYPRPYCRKCREEYEKRKKAEARARRFERGMMIFAFITLGLFAFIYLLYVYALR